MNEPTVINKPRFSGRLDKRRIQEDKDRYHLAAGMAKVALKAKLEGRPEVDARGVPLFYANRMASGMSGRELERISKQKKRVFSIP